MEMRRGGKGSFALFFCMLLLALLFAACAPRLKLPDIDYDVKADFTKLRSYLWKSEASTVEGHDPRLENALFEQRLREVVDQALMRKGFRQDEDPPPDFYVAYHLFIQKRAFGYAPFVYYPYPYYYPYFYPYYSAWGGFGPFWYGTFWQEFYWRERETVTLLLDFLDPVSGKLIWRGKAPEVFDLNASPFEQKQRLEAAVQFLLTRFPP